MEGKFPYIFQIRSFKWSCKEKLWVRAGMNRNRNTIVEGKLQSGAMEGSLTAESSRMSVAKTPKGGPGRPSCLLPDTSAQLSCGRGLSAAAAGAEDIPSRSCGSMSGWGTAGPVNSFAALVSAAAAADTAAAEVVTSDT